MLGNIVKSMTLWLIIGSFLFSSSVFAEDLPLPTEPVKKYNKPKDNFEMRKYDPSTKELLSDPTKREPLPEITDDMSEGEKLYILKGCVLCHKAKSSRLGPSLKKIARYYSGKQQRMVNYFKRKEKPLINPDRQTMMRSQFTKLTILSDEQLRELSAFMINGRTK